MNKMKAQFFILSAVAIVGILFFVSRWIEPLSLLDTSSIVFQEEPFVFNNIKEKAIETVNQSKDCEDLKFNLEEYSIFVKNYAREKLFLLDFSYSYDECIEGLPLDIVFNMTLKSKKIELASNFTVRWQT